MGEAETSDTQRKGAIREWSKLEVVAAEGKAKNNNKNNALWVRSCFKLFGSSQAENAHIHTNCNTRNRVVLEQLDTICKNKKSRQKEKNLKKEKKFRQRPYTFHKN